MRTASLIVSLLGLLAVAGCGGGGAAAPSASPAAAPPRAVAQSDAEIADLLYTDRQRVPAGFYAEPPRYDANYATLVHLRTTDVDTAASVPRELCSDDFATALAWSESVAAAAPVYGDLVETGSTERYHEFVRNLRMTPEHHVIARVYKCAYLDRGGVDLRQTQGPAGTFAKPAWSVDDLRALGEYLWTFTIDNNTGRVVLKSEATLAADSATHALHLARLVRATPPATCDRIEVSRIDLRGDRSSGALQRSETLLWSFGARRDAGVTQLCSAG